MRLGTPLEREFTLRSALFYLNTHADAVVVIGCALCFIIALHVS